MALLEKHLQVRESGIPNAGNGLFTDTFIAKTTRIVEYKGRICTWKEVENSANNLYIFYVSRRHVIDGSKRKKAVARYINDARGIRRIKGLNNNAEFVCEGLKVFVEATRDIHLGEEIFAGYGKGYWDVIRRNLKAEGKKG